jgi:hypothetical protein
VLVTVLVCLLGPALSGCGSNGDPPAGGTDEQTREWTVAADPHATPDQIIEAGRPVTVAAAHDRTLVTYLVESDDDEGPQQGAWRLYDGQDEPLVDGRLGQVREQGAVAAVDAVDDGFLVRGYTTPRLQHVTLDGRITTVPTPDTVSPAQAGDVLVEEGDDQGWRVYRPADHTAYRLPRLPFDDVQRVALGQDGVLWVLRSWTRTAIRLAHSAGGAAPWQRTDLPARPGSYPVGLTAENGRVVVPVAHGPEESPELGALEVLDTDAGSTWHAVNPRGIKLTQSLEPEVRVLPDGRLLVVGEDEGAWLQRASSGFAAVDLPDDDVSVDIEGQRWFTTYPRGRRLWVSDDAGTTWTDFGLPHTP